MTESLHMAVILAAGMGTRLKEEGKTKPKGFLHLGQRPIIQESIDKLLRVGITKIIIVTGHHFKFYERLKESYPGVIETVYNPHYAESGSMYSLYCAREQLTEEFLLLESDIIYEERALAEIMDFPQNDGVLASGPTDSGDEVYVAVHGERIIGMSKVLGEFDGELGATTAGELVGITKVSQALFKEMIVDAEAAFEETLQVAYETDCLSTLALRYPLYFHLVPDLIWSEIDDPMAFKRARNIVYPAMIKQARVV